MAKIVTADMLNNEYPFWGRDYLLYQFLRMLQDKFPRCNKKAAIKTPLGAVQI